MIKSNANYFLNILLLIFFLGVCIYMFLSIYKIVTTIAPDFTIYYQSTVDLAHKINPYTAKNMQTLFIYPPVTTLLYLPLIIFSYSLSQGIFVVLSALTVPSIVFISIKLLGKKISWEALFIFTALSFLSFPTKFTLGMGQVNLIALFFLMVGYYFYKNNRLPVSILFLTLSFLAKPILCFMILFFIAQKAWKILFYLLLTCLFLFLFSSVLYGYGMESYYQYHIVPDLISSTSGREVYYNQGLMGFISRLTIDPNLRKYLSIFLDIVIFGYGCYIMMKNKVQKNMQFAIFLTLLPLLDTLSWQHYFVFLIFPFILAASLIHEKKKYLLSIPLIIAYLLISWNFKNPSAFSGFPEILLLSNTFFGGLILLALLLDLSRLSKSSAV